MDSDTEDLLLQIRIELGFDSVSRERKRYLIELINRRLISGKPKTLLRRLLEWLRGSL